VKPVKDFRISKELVDKLTERGIETLFPIQHKTFDHIYDGKDLIGRGEALALCEAHQNQHELELEKPWHLSFL
jgi:hypothetical protein